jgi:hypothetical protein
LPFNGKGKADIAGCRKGEGVIKNRFEDSGIDESSMFPPLYLPTNSASSIFIPFAFSRILLSIVNIINKKGSNTTGFYSFSLPLSP